MVWKRFNRGSKIDAELDLSNPTISLVLRVLENHLGELAKAIFIDTCQASKIAPSKINTKNIDKFSEHLQELTTEHLGDLGAKYLSINLKKSLA